MDLRNNQITLGELLDYPPAKKILARRFPLVINRPIVANSRSMSLDRVIKLGSAYEPKKVIQDTIQELKSL